MTGDHWPMQLRPMAFIRRCCTSVGLVELWTRMAFLSAGVLAMLLSSVRLTWPSMPTATTFVRIPPDVMFFSLSASTYNRALRVDCRKVMNTSDSLNSTSVNIYSYILSNVHGIDHIWYIVHEAYSAKGWEVLRRSVTALPRRSVSWHGRTRQFGLM